MADNKSYGYIAYIDEAGDPGLSRVKPIDPNGASEWLILAGTLVQERYEADVPQWGKEFVMQCGTKQMSHFHFRSANLKNKTLACERLSALPVRNFVICTNKKNMKGYRNPYASRRSSDLAGVPHSKNWFYFWVVRILLEKMTGFAHAHSIKTHGKSLPIKFEFSERGGISYNELRGYLQLLRSNDKLGNQTVTYDAINWAAINDKLIEVYSHKSRAGLILPDIVASSFYMACDKHERNSPVDPRPAIRLNPRMARRADTLSQMPAGFGVKLMPNVRVANLDKDQQQIFNFYGYKFK